MAGNKTDMERIGLLSEMGYISLGDRYPKVDPKSRGFNEAAGKRPRLYTNLQLCNQYSFN